MDEWTIWECIRHILCNTQLTGSHQQMQKNGDKSLRNTHKVAIIFTFISIVVHVQIFGLKRSKKAFPVEIFPWNAIYANIRIKSTFS